MSRLGDWKWVELAFLDGAFMFRYKMSPYYSVGGLLQKLHVFINMSAL